jgi:hypothetical protein
MHQDYMGWMTIAYLLLVPHPSHNNTDAPEDFRDNSTLCKLTCQH